MAVRERTESERIAAERERYGNVIRILVPLSIDDALLDHGLDLLEESLGDAGAA